MRVDITKIEMNHNPSHRQGSDRLSGSSQPNHRGDSVATNKGELCATTKLQSNGKHEIVETWSEQKQRMDEMLEVLRSEFRQVQSIDKDLTRQFIILGGKINKLKVNQTQLLMQLEEEIAEDIFEDGETSTKETLSLDTKL